LSSIYTVHGYAFLSTLAARLAAFGLRAPSLRALPLPHIEKLFAPILPAGLLAQAQSGANSRQRLYSLRGTFWGFLWQMLHPATLCREVVRQIQALFSSADWSTPVDEGTSAYCQARQRLPLEVLQRARTAAAEHAEKLLPQDQQRWRGWRLKVTDGSTLSLADTPANQRAYPQLQSQQPGCGFPRLKIVGVFSLASGALLGYAKGNKHTAELPLLFRLRSLLQSGDLLLADRGFCSYVVMALLEMMGVACLFRLHHARPDDLRGGIRLGKKDRLVVWRKPQLKPRYLPKTLWRKVPEELTVRVLRVKLDIPGLRTQTITLATTLSDAEAYPAQELAALYLRRWRIELWWRHLKTSTGNRPLPSWTRRPFVRPTKRASEVMTRPRKPKASNVISWWTCWDCCWPSVSRKPTCPNEREPASWRWFGARVETSTVCAAKRPLTVCCAAFSAKRMRRGCSKAARRWNFAFRRREQRATLIWPSGSCRVKSDNGMRLPFGIYWKMPLELILGTVLNSLLANRRWTWTPRRMAARAIRSRRGWRDGGLHNFILT
jgi:hypothetical protein